MVLTVFGSYWGRSTLEVKIGKMTQCSLGFQAIVFLLIAVCQMALLDAHPPEFHRKGVKVSSVSTLAENKLTGEEFEWKLIELRWREAGNYQIEMSAGDLPARNENRVRFRLSIPTKVDGSD